MIVVTVIYAINLEREDNLLRRPPGGLTGLKFNDRAQQPFPNRTLTQATLQSASLWPRECAFPLQQRLKTADCISLAGAETLGLQNRWTRAELSSWGRASPVGLLEGVLFPR